MASLENENISIAELISELETRTRVSYGLMLRVSDGAWTLQAMMSDTHLSSRARFVYNYGHVAFLGGTVNGVRLGSWLKNRKGRVAGFNFVIPQLQENIFSDRYPSHTKREMFLSLTEPYSIHRIHISGRVEHSTDFSPLVKAGCPSFPNLREAAYEFLYGLNYQSGNREPDDITVRVAHPEAWLKSLQLHRNGISITVNGTHVAGTRLELMAGSNKRFDTRLRKPGRRRFSLPQGLPERLWVGLSRDDRWLDYRDIDLRGRAPTREDVVIDAPDVCGQLKGLIERGESETREFKREVPRDRNNTFLKTIAAFANGKGGVVLFGVVDDTGEIKGIMGDLQQEKDRVVNMICDNVVPRPNLRVESCNLSGKQIIAVFVEEGELPPYGLDAANPRFYIRRGATTFPANQTEIRAFVKKFDSAAEDYSFYRFRF